MTFKELGIIPSILKALTTEGYEQPTPIQEEAIPPVLAGKDLLGCAQTGTGKTAAFAVPILQRLQAAHPQKRVVRTLVLTPTRELAMQIKESFLSYGRNLQLRSTVMFGGVSQGPQVLALQRGVDVLVATPGRLNDLIGQGFVDLSHVEVFVLDEADRMLDMGFIQDVKKIIAKLPHEKQTLLFSATMPREIEKLADELLHEPVKVAVTPPATTVEAIAQSVYFVDKDNKRLLLIHLLQDASITSALVFTRTKHGADRVVKELTRAKISAQAIHGNKSQSARQAALTSFKKGELRVLVATDIAARGIDIDDLSHVFNYDIPEVPETYVHRIGRTGRAGLSGTAIAFCDINEKSDFANILRLIRVTVPVVENHPYPMMITTPTPKAELRRQGRMEARAEMAARGVEQRRSSSASPRQGGRPAQQGGTSKKKIPSFATPPQRQGGRPAQPARSASQPSKPAAREKAALQRPAQERKPLAGKPGLEKPSLPEHRRQDAPAFRPMETLRNRPSDQPLSDKPFTRRG